MAAESALRHGAGPRTGLDAANCAVQRAGAQEWASWRSVAPTAHAEALHQCRVTSAVNRMWSVPGTYAPVVALCSMGSASGMARAAKLCRKRGLLVITQEVQT